MNVYRNDNPVDFNVDRQLYQKATPIGTKLYSSGKIIDLFSYMEPRFTMSYAFNDQQSVKASYARTVIS